MAFIEGEFPKTISFKAMGGPGFNTTVNEGFSGFEQRNSNWKVARGKWSVSLHTPAVGYITNEQQYLDQLTAFFLIVKGKQNGFRLKDHKDHNSNWDGVNSGQFLGVADGSTGVYQLIKSYSSVGQTYTRSIIKPVTSKVVDYQGNALGDTVYVFAGATNMLKNAGYVGGGLAQFTLDETTGLVSFGGYSTLSLSGVTQVGTTSTFAYIVTAGNAPQRNQTLIITGMTLSSNNFPVGAQALITSVSPTSSTAGTFTVTNAGGGTESASTGTGTTSAATCSISAVSMAGSSATYTYTLSVGSTPLVQGMRVTIKSLGTAGNNGTFWITGLGSGTFTVLNPSGVNASGQTGTGNFDWVPQATVVLTATYDFHFPVRFDTDELEIQVDDSDVKGGQPQVSWNSITMRELRILAGDNQG